MKNLAFLTAIHFNTQKQNLIDFVGAEIYYALSNTARAHVVQFIVNGAYVYLPPSVISKVVRQPVEFGGLAVAVSYNNQGYVHIANATGLFTISVSGLGAYGLTNFANDVCAHGRFNLGNFTKNYDFLVEMLINHIEKHSNQGDSVHVFGVLGG